MRRVGWIVAVVAVVMLGGCGSSSMTGSAATTATSIPRHVGTPRNFGEDTFIETRAADDRVAIARLADGKVLQILTPARTDTHWRLNTEAMRTQAGHLVTGSWSSWRDTTTGFAFTGTIPKLSPDGTEIATKVDHADRSETIRRYELATGRIVAELLVLKKGDNYGGILGFDWTPDSRGFVVSTGGIRAAGLHIVDLAARVLPDLQQALPQVPKQAAGLWGIAVLSDDHALAYYSTLQQRTAWPAELVDIDLRTGARRTIAGGLYRGDFLLNSQTPIEARGDTALITDGNSNTYLYDGRALRKIATGNYATHR